MSDSNFDLSDDLYGSPQSASATNSFDLSNDLYGNILPSSSVASDINNSGFGQQVSGGINNAADVMGDIINPIIGGKYKDQVQTPDLNSLKSKGWGDTTGPERAGAIQEALFTSPPGKIAGILGATPIGATIGAGIGSTNNFLEKTAGIPHQYSQLAELPLIAMFGKGKEVANGIQSDFREMTTPDNPPPGGGGGATNILANKNSGAYRTPETTPSFDPYEIHKSINNTYKQAQSSRAPFYNHMNDTASGQTIDVTPAMEAANKAINEINSDPFHPARGVLTRLQGFVEDAQSNPNMPLADAVQMKQDINSYFKPKNFTQGNRSPFFKVGSFLDQSIDNAGKLNPDFADAKNLADRNYVNNIALPFTENDVLKPFWRPEDYYGQKSIEAGKADSLPFATQKRAQNIVSSIKDPIDLKTISQLLPPEQSAMLRQAVIDNIKNGSGSSRLKSLGQAAMSAADLAPLSTLKHVYETINPIEFTAEQKRLMTAAQKNARPVDLSGYQKKLDNLKKSFNDKKSLSKGGQ